MIAVGFGAGPDAVVVVERSKTPAPAQNFGVGLAPLNSHLA
jgi:hypothetical protein